MPTYSYRCTECGNAFDIQQSFTDDSLTECPSCGGLLRKVFSPVGVTFSGSGFYRTDSRSKPAESGSSDSTGGSADSSGSSDSGGTTKSDAPKKEPAKKESATPAAKAAASTPASGS